MSIGIATIFSLDKLKTTYWTGNCRRLRDGICIRIWDIKNVLGTRVSKTYFYPRLYISYTSLTSAKQLRLRVCESLGYLAINSDYSCWFSLLAPHDLYIISIDSIYIWGTMESDARFDMSISQMTTKGAFLFNVWDLLRLKINQRHYRYSFFF